jgi:hypothetical protein
VIVGYQPGGTIRDARVVLQPNETLPNRFNVIGTTVWRENPDNPREWLLVKAKDVELSADSPLLTQQEVVPVDIKDLTTEEKGGSFEHVDIIRFDD